MADLQLSLQAIQQMQLALNTKGELLIDLDIGVTVGGYVVSDVYQDTDGNLMFVLSDGSEVNAGTIRGEAFTYEDFTPEQLALLKGEQGDPFTYEDFTPQELLSLKGEKGDTPIKGVDYFDGEDGYTPIKGIDYIDGINGTTPVKGVDYFDGEDGYTPVKGVDYVDGINGITPVKGIDYVDGIDGEDGLGITEQAIGFTLTGGTTAKTLTVPLDASVSGNNTGDQNLSPYALKAFVIAMGVAL